MTCTLCSCLLHPHACILHVHTHVYTHIHAGIYIYVQISIHASRTRCKATVQPPFYPGACHEHLINQCGSDSVCFTNMLCTHNDVCQSWKDQNCVGETAMLQDRARCACCLELAQIFCHPPTNTWSICAIQTVVLQLAKTAAMLFCA